MRLQKEKLENDKAIANAEREKLELQHLYQMRELQRQADAQTVTQFNGTDMRSSLPALKYVFHIF